MGYICSKDPSHVSDDSDYCSICGAPIASSSASSTSSIDAAQTSTPATNDVCPDCGTPRSGTAVFCEVCRYNFSSGQSYGVQKSVPTVVSATQPADLSNSNSASDPLPDSAPTQPVGGPSAAPTVVTIDGTATKYDAVTWVDSSLYTDPDPSLPCPTDLAERVFPLDFAENLIGRRSASKGSFPEIGLSDPGVSHRHAKILIEAGGPVLLELGSTNGTQLNGAPVEVGVKTSLSIGDFITLGCWTRMEIRVRA